MKKTKIVATIGPASESPEILRKMIKSGMNVCRLNFSHGEYSWHKKAIAKIRKAAKAEKKHVAILADIQGPRIRIASVKPVQAKKSEKIFVTDRKNIHTHGHKKEIALDWDGFYAYIKKGDRIYIEDGIIDLEVVEKKKGGCSAKVVQGGEIKPKKGVNIPSISPHLGFLTNKDLMDLDFILENEVEYIGVSFVGSKKDLLVLRSLMEKWKKKKEIVLKARRKKKKINLPHIVSKIERRSAILNLKDVVANSDAVMVARGDLAIEMPQQKVGVLQKDIAKECLRQKKPVIVATQMLNSMIEIPRPTRAEITDVTNAVVDEADAVMLSGETAQGKYPQIVIETMAQIISEAEKSPYNDVILKVVNKFAKVLKRAKKNRQKIVRPKTLKEAINYAVLRQEDIKICLTCKDTRERNLASLVWGVE